MSEITLGAMRYSIKNTGESSRRLGPCEVCGRDASEVYRQSIAQDYVLDSGSGRIHRGDLFGHRRCLLRVRGDEHAMKAALVRAGDMSAEAA